jgi:hypothetical protein
LQPSYREQFQKIKRLWLDFLMEAESLARPGTQKEIFGWFRK